MAYLGFGLNTPALLRVSMGWAGGATGGGVLGSAGDEGGLDATSRGGDAVDDGGVSGTGERVAVDSGGVGVVGVAPVEGDALGEIDTPAEVDAPSEGDARGCGVDGGDLGVDDVDRGGGGEDAVGWADGVGTSRTVA
jgi:hypothetical protein